ncbi:hypothetical protein FA048_14960 [Pedobacter polaris]|uniref:MepB family protein n=1 Tax=Pedobacter polaris TaxID=2571273 RepID=A0A4U1CM47_9SPHI|nr:MepB family protein [Pedobacter polaris]TKC06512.1 hypothetical protein FA048_14960 [Pedobacter polaris]
MNINNLAIAKNLIYDKCGFNFSELKIEEESAEYDACTFQLNSKSVLHRTAKITPTKTGQFVTIWKRDENGETTPFHVNDDFDLIIISTRNGDLFGQFIFPKSILLEKGIVSNPKKQGKRGIRVYPSWDITTNKQAKKTQLWQLNYFIDASAHLIDINRINQLMSLA